MKTADNNYCYGCAFYDEEFEMCICNFNEPEEVEASWCAERDEKGGENNEAKW